MGAIGLATTLWAGGASTQSGKDYWAFQPVKDVAPPADTSGWAWNEIDQFVIAKLREKGLTPNPVADKRTLLRRVYFDVVGLPPTPEQVEAFRADTSKDAFRKVVEGLLESPHYGERWGRHWLDLARYADTSGDGADDPVPEAYHYRDYVIDCFNQDLPYDQFIVEQIAGDLLLKEQPDTRARERLIATSYIGLTRRFNNGEYRDMHLVIDNTLDTIGQGMLGMTLGCARCHDHKFDPISSEDYYGLYGYFSSTQYPHAGTESGRMRKNFTDLPGGGLAYGVFDKTSAKEIGDAYVLVRGEPSQRGAKAPRGFLRVIDDSDPKIPEGESGRLELARWIASRDNPLTARVMANRIWQYHFGRGIVATSSIFGKQGAPPTHPELLDWLAGEFVRQGWSIKAMHREMLLSHTYQLASDTDDARLTADPNNEYLWRFARHRLDAEPMRDATLFVSGRLKEGSPGRPPFPEPDKKNEYPYTQHNPFRKDYTYDYRTVYLPSRRLDKHPYWELFNGADPNNCTGHRDVSTVPLQSLYWMNSDFVEENARGFAERVLAEQGAAGDHLRLAIEMAYARPPEAGEARQLTDYVNQYEHSLPDSLAESERELRAWTSLCRILLASNEFIYVD